MSKIKFNNPPGDMLNLLSPDKGTEVDEVPYDPGTQPSYTPESPRTYAKDLWPRKFQYLLDVPRIEASSEGNYIVVASEIERAQSGTAISFVPPPKLLESITFGSDPDGDIVEQEVEVKGKNNVAVDLVVRHSATTSDASVLRVGANLGDLLDATESRDNLGLGTVATLDCGTDPEEVPQNKDLGSAAYVDVAQSLGASEELLISQKTVTEELSARPKAGTDSNEVRTNNALDTRYIQGGSVVQTTGQSTTDVMSQNAVTEAIGANPSFVTGYASFLDSDNKIILTDFAVTLGLQIGDVIQVEGSLYNDKIFTVDYVYDDDKVGVNLAHRNGAGPLSLVLEVGTSGVTIRRLAKWYQAPIYLGRQWVELAVPSQRTGATTYTSPANRAIMVKVALDGGNSYGVLQINETGYNNNSAGNFMFGTERLVPPSTDYGVWVGSGTIKKWFELR